MAAAARLTLLLLSFTGLLWLAGARFIDYCPEGWSYYKLSCFKYFRQLHSWDEAERQCQASHANAHLAWVEEPQEAATLRKVISYYQRVQPVWLGLRYRHKSWAWQWASGNTYSLSHGLDGNGAHEGTCGVLSHLTDFALWSRANCTERHHYICKFIPLQ